MPIVDTYACFDGVDASVSRYLQSAEDTHVLRMVAVQHSSDTQNTIEWLHSLQAQSTTKGLGGFPNAIIARVDLYDHNSVEAVLAVKEIQKLRGLHHVFALSVKPDIPTALELLVNQNLSLDVSDVHGQLATIEHWASAKPTLPIMLNIALSDLTSAELASDFMRELQGLAAMPNVSVKIHGAGLAAVDIDVRLSQILKPVLEVFGDERIVFGSGQAGSGHVGSEQASSGHVSSERVNADQNHAVATFDERWKCYSSACEHYSAQTRDKLLRTNGVGFYLS